MSALAVLTLTAAMGITTPTSALAHSSCAVRWGSQSKLGMPLERMPIANVRAGRHACFDRLVVDVAGDVTGAYIVGYVPEVHSEASGVVGPLRGGADLTVEVGAPNYDASGTAGQTYRPAKELVDVRGWRTFRQVASGGSFEGYHLLGVGVRARLPFRVMVLPGPGTGSRLVIDVAHSWRS
jgi:hypothetical protein